MQHKNLHYDHVREAFDSGAVLEASKEDLEQLLLAVGRARVLDPANQARAAEMGETLRQLLAARQSQELHNNANRVAKVALYISIAALVAGVIQALAALNIIEPLKPGQSPAPTAAPTK